MRFYISHFTLTGERIPELIEPEVINVTAHKRERKPKAAYEEMFDNLPHSYVSAGLAPHAMYGKFINALPYYRQEKDFKNPFGVKIGRGAMVH